jgi:sulfate adenylyltransferase subunit 1
LAKETDVETIQLNEIGKLEIKTASPLVFDSYKELRSNGGAILIDETTNLTAAALILQ